MPFSKNVSRIPTSNTDKKKWEQHYKRLLFRGNEIRGPSEVEESKLEPAFKELSGIPSKLKGNKQQGQLGLLMSS